VRGFTVKMALAGAKRAPAELARGYVVYRGVSDFGANLIHRVLPVGTEDYLSLESAPPGHQVQYHIELGEAVAGLRLVSHQLEFLDATGDPRLRMDRPYLVDAKAERHAAEVSVAGCDVDTDARAPWG